MEFTAEALVVVAAARGPPPRCPGCCARAQRVHSSYERRLAERPLAGTKLLVRLRVRRFFCDRSRCRRRTFVEQVSGLSERSRRSSLGLKTWLREVAVELGGRAGERLCRRMHLAALRAGNASVTHGPPVPARNRSITRTSPGTANGLAPGAVSPTQRGPHLPGRRLGQRIAMPGT
ncbi:transposase family protein [Streptomyces sp. NRRL S-87]|uniref:transposase family protein n=1 Tax=Streptomyces sp. NRRL S-87 TaxID=1463920 RepID=UPI00131EB960|nr:transposase family protein [Streptomyces sp. NRRL S-87]